VSKPKKLKSQATAQRTGIVVLGMHRSGTSALTRVLNLLGCDLPKTLMQASPTNEAGHWESLAIYRLNDRILESAASAWQLEFNPSWFGSPRADEFVGEAVATIADEFGSSRFLVLKDPRICRLLPFWVEVLDRCHIKPSVLIPLRNPLEVAASIEKRDHFDPALGYLLWLRHILDAEAASRELPRHFSTYDQLLENWGALVRDAGATLGVHWPRLSDRSAGEIEAFLAEGHRHHRKLSEAVVGNPNLSSWIRDTFSIMGRWALSGEDSADYSALDRIRRAFDAAAPAFARLVASGQAARLKASKLEASLSESARERVAALQVAETGRAAIEAKVAAGEVALAEARQHAAQLEGDWSARSRDAETTHAQLRNELQRREEVIQALEQALANSERRAGELEAARTAMEAKVSGAETSFAEERDHAAKLRDELTARAQDAEAAATQLRGELQRRGETIDAFQRAQADSERREGEREAARTAMEEKVAAGEVAFAARLEAELGARMRGAEATVAQLRGELQRREEAIQALEQAQADGKRREGEWEAARTANEARATAGDIALAELREHAARLEDELGARARSAEAQLTSELLLREEEIHRLEEARADSERRGDELEAAYERQQGRVVLLVGEVGVMRGRLADDARTITAIRLEMDEQAGAAIAAEREAVDLRNRLSVTESALAQRSHEAEETSAELTAVRRELQETARLRTEAGKIVHGLKEHVDLLIVDAKERSAAAIGAHGELGQAREQAAKAVAEATRLLRELGEAKAAVDAIKSETASAVNAERSRLETRMREMRLALAKETAKTVTALLDGRTWRLVPGRIRVRRQMALLQRSGVFDAQWYIWKPTGMLVRTGQIRCGTIWCTVRMKVVSRTAPWPT